ncbi:DNA-binding protein [Bradyrhizobium jicamae]|uniref:DNA-binding protein n=1 Tax=Bradyrhizobium jicamae TaxID=280332 RepID=A0ABS5FKJ2_9BRAD|nr:DNA-binding protein [Bradyrhizobium jicamae]MBR0797309.1 DNA-binding protein [Bradyrhizobium jicamae]
MSLDDFTGRNLPARLVAARYGICGRTLSRWIETAELAFPQPIVINKRRYFSEDALTEWDRRRAHKVAEVA